MNEIKTEPGKKFDANKPRMDLLPPDALLGAARVLTYGADKYGERNWEGGMSWGRSYGALLRHMMAWASGETHDAETGLPHLDHAMCCLLFLSAYEKRGVGKDDRNHLNVGPTPASNTRPLPVPAEPPVKIFAPIPRATDTPQSKVLAAMAAVEREITR